MGKEDIWIEYCSQWPVYYEQEIETSLSRIWEIISNPGHLEFFHPYCKRNKALKWPGENAIDFLTYNNGMIYKREIIQWNDKDSFSLVIGEINSSKSYVKWEFKENKENSKVKITVYPHLLINWPRSLSFLPYKLYIIPQLRKYLKAVLNGLKYYAESGTKVRQGSEVKHPWFS